MKTLFRSRRPYSVLTRITGVALGLTALAYASELLTLGLDREVGIVVAVLSFACLLVWSGWRWTPALGAVIVGGILLNNPWLRYNLSLPLTNSFFLAALAQAVFSFVAIGAGLAATVQNYWPTRRQIV